MKFTNLTLAVVAAAGLAFVTGCEEEPGATFGDREMNEVSIDTPEEVEQEDVQFGAPEREEPLLQGDIDNTQPQPDLNNQAAQPPQIDVDPDLDGDREVEVEGDTLEIER